MKGRSAMSYVQKVLQPDETVSKIGRIHWITYVPGVIWFCFSVIVFVAAQLAPESDQGKVVFVSVVLAFLGFVSLFRAWFRRWTTEIAITNHRVIYKTGLIARRTVEMNIAKVESVDVNQSVLGRILNFGTITIKGTGAGIEALRDISKPLDLRSAVTTR